MVQLGRFMGRFAWGLGVLCFQSIGLFFFLFGSMHALAQSRVLERKTPHHQLPTSKMVQVFADGGIECQENRQDQSGLCIAKGNPYAVMGGKSVKGDELRVFFSKIPCVINKEKTLTPQSRLKDRSGFLSRKNVPNSFIQEKKISNKEMAPMIPMMDSRRQIQRIEARGHVEFSQGVHTQDFTKAKGDHCLYDVGSGLLSLWGDKAEVFSTKILLQAQGNILYNTKKRFGQAMGHVLFQQGDLKITADKMEADFVEKKMVQGRGSKGKSLVKHGLNSQDTDVGQLSIHKAFAQGRVCIYVPEGKAQAQQGLYDGTEEKIYLWDRVRIQRNENVLYGQGAFMNLKDKSVLIEGQSEAGDIFDCAAGKKGSQSGRAGIFPHKQCMANRPLDRVNVLKANHNPCRGQHHYHDKSCHQARKKDIFLPPEKIFCYDPWHRDKDYKKRHTCLPKGWRNATKRALGNVRVIALIYPKKLQEKSKILDTSKENEGKKTMAWH
jgi:lipopolysaccharide export system protein LptA